MDGGNTYWLYRCLAPLQPADLLTIVIATQVARGADWGWWPCGWLDMYKIGRYVRLGCLCGWLLTRLTVKWLAGYMGEYLARWLTDFICGWLATFMWLAG